MINFYADTDVKLLSTALDTSAYIGIAHLILSTAEGAGATLQVRTASDSSMSEDVVTLNADVAAATGSVPVSLSFNVQDSAGYIQVTAAGEETHASFGIFCKRRS